MNKHLLLAQELRNALTLSQPDSSNFGHLSDMDIVQRQSWLMSAGSRTLRALKQGEMAIILLHLTELAYCALGAIAAQGEDLIEKPVFWRHDGSVLSVMLLLSDKINRCTSGKAIDYSAVYCACRHLTCSFLNADFDMAMDMFHRQRMTSLKSSTSGNPEEAPEIHADLSECLYE